MYSVARGSLVFTFVLCVFAVVPPAVAHEADQYTYPPQREFADLGPYLTRYFYDAIERGVNATNQQIKAAVQAGRKDQVSNLQSPQTLAVAVNHEFPVALMLIQALDDNLPKPESRQHYPGRITVYKPGNNLREYVDMPLSPFNAWRCGSMKVFGSYVGTDKIGHFTDMGMHYYDKYQEMRAKGASEEQAIAEAIKQGTDDPITSESGLLGWATAGAYSNADLVANFTGFLFYRNLCEPVMLKGQMRDPMCVLQDGYWKITPRVRPDSDFYSLFISDHLNEAFNPSWYIDRMKKPIGRAIAERSTAVLEEYTDRFGNRHSQDWFRAKQRELETYYGMNYGHRGNGSQLMSIADMCFGAEPDAIDKHDRVGRTPLHIAAERGDVAKMQELVDKGANVNAPVRSSEEMNSDWGDTPLHLAVRDGKIDAVRYLISRGADVKAANDRGVTALHLASHHPQVAEALIAAGAKLDAIDAQGRTPLQWAAFDPEDQQARVVALLVKAGAPLNARDHQGSTALSYAISAGNADAAYALVKSGADVNLSNQFGEAPLHLAAASAKPQLVDLLIRGGAKVNAVDDFGCTPLHDATRAGATYAMALLLRSGADSRAKDSYGGTPLHLASRYGREDLATILLNSGADVLARSSAGAMPIDEAQRAGAGSLVQMLRDAAIKAAGAPGGVPTAAADTSEAARFSTEGK